MLTCAWNFQKAQSRKWFKSVDICGTGTRFRVSCVRDKYANHIHHARFMILLKSFNINIYEIYIHFLYNLIQNTSHLWPCLTSAFKASEVDRKHVILLPEIFFHQKNKPGLFDGVKHQHMEHILPQIFLLTPETERSHSQCGRVTFSQIISSLQQHFSFKYNRIIIFILYYLPSKYLLHH